MGGLNATIVRRAYEDFARGDIPAVFAAFDPTISWLVPGHSPISGKYRGHQQIVLWNYPREPSALMSRTLLRMTSSLVIVTAQRNGVYATFPDVHVWRVKDDKAVEFREYQGDEQRENQFWS